MSRRHMITMNVGPVGPDSASKRLSFPFGCQSDLERINSWSHEILAVFRHKQLSPELTDHQKSC